MPAPSIVINFRDFDVDRMAVPAKLSETATSAKVPEKMPKADEIKIRYRHPTTVDGKIIDNEGTLLIAAPELFTFSGVKSKAYTEEGGSSSESKTKAPTLSVFVSFDMTNADQRDYVGTFSNKYTYKPDGEEDIESSGFLGTMYDWACEQMYNYYKYQQRQQKPREAIGEGFPEKIVLMRKRYGKDDKGIDESLMGTLVPNTNPVKFLKVRTFGIPGTPTYNEATFLTPSGKVIPLAQLSDLKFRFIPHILWRRIWIGQQKGFTHEITGAIITEIIQGTGISLRLEEARQELLSRNPDIAAKVDEMLALTSDADKTKTKPDEDSEDKKELELESAKSILKLKLQGIGN